VNGNVKLGGVRRLAVANGPKHFSNASCFINNNHRLVAGDPHA